MKNILLAGLLSLWSLSSQSQTITNIRAAQLGDKVEIQYDLADEQMRDFFVRVYASQDGGKTFNIGLSEAEGEVNKLVKPGLQRKIVWKAMNELGEYRGMLRFRVIGLASTALGKAENKDFVLGAMDIRLISKERVQVGLSLLCKSPSQMSFDKSSFITDNFGNIYTLLQGVVGGYSYNIDQGFEGGETTYCDLIFELNRVNHAYTGGAPTEFQLRLSYGDDATLIISRIAVPKQ